MTNAQAEKIKRFMTDKVMQEAVYDVLLAAFLKPKPTASTEEKAASFIAIERLQEGWRELERVGPKDEHVERPLNQVGL
jgi:hypothetical protein